MIRALSIVAVFTLTLIGGTAPQVDVLLSLPASEQPVLQDLSRQYQELERQRALLDAKTDAMRLRACLELELKKAECGPLTPDGRLTKYKLSPKE